MFSSKESFTVCGTSDMFTPRSVCLFSFNLNLRQHCPHLQRLDQTTTLL